MDKESDIEFLDNLELWVIGSLVFKRDRRNGGARDVLACEENSRNIRALKDAK